MSRIRFKNVRKTLGGKTILDGIDFEVEQGDIFVIVGPSGAGKSVTLKHMVRLMTPDAGDVFIDDDCVNAASGSALSAIRDRFGYLFQGGALLAWMTVEENVALPLLEKTDMKPEEISKKVGEALRRVGLEKDGSKAPSEISGGMAKRAGLARAIIHDPEIILYDEPTSGLDPVTARTIDELIARTRDELGGTSVVVTHDLHSALSIGTKIAMLYEGKIVEIATPEDFIKSTEPIVRDFLESQYITRRGAWERSVA